MKKSGISEKKASIATIFFFVAICVLALFNQPVVVTLLFATESFKEELLGKLGGLAEKKEQARKLNLNFIPPTQ